MAVVEGVEGAETMKSFVACAEEKTCINKKKCIENGVLCVHLIVGFEKELKK